MMSKIVCSVVLKVSDRPRMPCWGSDGGLQMIRKTGTSPILKVEILTGNRIRCALALSVWRAQIACNPKVNFVSNFEHNQL